MKIALVQLTSSNDPSANLQKVETFIREAHAGGAEFVLTPETTNIISSNRQQQAEVLNTEADDPSLARLRELASELDIWLLIGSLGIKTGDTDGRFANRSFLISPAGEIQARYDKIHMFDVDLGNGEVYRESSAYRPGTKATLAKTDIGNIGMTICYDMRFSTLYRQLAQAGAEILTAPAAFTVPSGKAHWHALLRARAIENGCFVLAPAQVGEHRYASGKVRHTYGHSLAVSPWGEVLADAGEDPGVCFAELDMAEVDAARGRVPSLSHDRTYRGVK